MRRSTRNSCIHLRKQGAAPSNWAPRHYQQITAQWINLDFSHYQQITAQSIHLDLNYSLISYSFFLLSHNNPLHKHTISGFKVKYLAKITRKQCFRILKDALSFTFCLLLCVRRATALCISSSAFHDPSATLSLRLGCHRDRQFCTKTNIQMYIFFFTCCCFIIPPAD